MLTLQGRLGDRAVVQGQAETRILATYLASDTPERWGLDFEVGGQPGRRQGKRSSLGVAGVWKPRPSHGRPSLFSVELRVWPLEDQGGPAARLSSAWLAPP